MEIEYQTDVENAQIKITFIYIFRKYVHMRGHRAFVISISIKRNRTYNRFAKPMMRCGTDDVAMHICCVWWAKYVLYGSFYDGNSAKFIVICEWIKYLWFVVNTEEKTDTKNYMQMQNWHNVIFNLSSMPICFAILPSLKIGGDWTMEDVFVYKGEVCFSATVLSNT